MIKKLSFALLLFILAFNFYAGAQMKLTGDPWIKQAYQELYSRQPNAWEYNIKNYNSGSWNNYSELKNYVSQYQSSMTTQRLNTSTALLPDNNIAVFFVQGGKSIAVDLIAQDGGTLIAAGAGNIALNSGANFLSKVGITVKSDLAGVYFGSKYAVQSTGTKVIPVSGKGALIIR